MSVALDVLSWIAILGGSFFSIVGGFGLLKFPDFYTRIHAAGVTDSLGATLLLFGLLLQAGWTLVAVKLLLVAAFLLMTSPTAAHALVKAAHGRGVRLELPLPPRAGDPVPEITEAELEGQESFPDAG